MILNDPFGAFCRHTHVALAGSGRGPLQVQTMAVKDVFDIADHRTGNGHPLGLERLGSCRRGAGCNNLNNCEGHRPHMCRSGAINGPETVANHWRTAPYTGNAPRAGRQGRTH